jgi:hypothetical protein
MNRRELITGASALALTACSPSSPVATTTTPPAADPFSGARLMADVEAYVGFGTHRTGSPGDVSTTDWFAEHWSKLGYDVSHMDVTCPNADTTAASVRIGDESFEGFAQPPLVFTPAGGLSAPLAWWNVDKPADVQRRIALIHVAREPGAVSPGAAYREAARRAAAAGAVGVVMVMSSPSGEIVAINTPVDMTLDIPVLQIGEKERARLDAAMASSAPATLTIEGPGGERTGRNTIARHGTEGPWVIISTPQSGWFTCGGERGPGIAMSRALSEWALTTNFPVRWLFVATSGHEWIDHGAHLFHVHEAPKPPETALWFHLGASYAARAYQETPSGLVAQDTPNLTRALMATPDLVPLIEAAFAGHPVIDTPMPADLSKALGEYRLVLEEGYPSGAGFWGGNAHFHTPIDGADSTTPAIMEPIARAVAKVIEGRLAQV